MTSRPPRRNTPAAAKLSAKDKKLRFVDLLAGGESVEAAARVIGCSPQTHEYYMKSDADYRSKVLAIRATQGRRSDSTEVPEFAEFREKYLGRKSFWHQLQWIDVIEGRAPRDPHPAEIYEPRDLANIIINTPPNHAKSTTITCDYVVYRICKDPNVNIVIVSKTLDAAKKWMYQVQTILTHHKYSALQADFAPPGGFKADADSWTKDKIYLGQGVRDSGDKDPTLQVLGMGQQIYGARADLIILDDCIVLANAGEYEKQIDWITQEVGTRPGANGTVLVVGTRVSAQDLYSELRNPSRYEDGEPFWTYFAQPALLDADDDPKNWRTLWPRTDQPCGCRAICQKNMDPDEDGLFPKWDGPHLRRLRSSLANRSTWARVYQQLNVASDQVFRPECVAQAINGMRTVGPLVPGAPGHPEHGMDGLYLIGSMDPAMAGFTAAIVYAVDRASQKRYIVDLHNQQAMTPLAIRALIHAWTERYRLNEWRIEGNAFQNYLAQDQELKDWLASRGCVLNPHITGRNKWDPDFGVASMAPLFGDVSEGKVTRHPMIDIPSTKQVEATKALVEQLIVWQPSEQRGRSAKTDLVMALWFAEIRAREVLQHQNYSSTHIPNKYVVPYQRRQQYSVNLNDAWTAKQIGMTDADYLPVIDPEVELPEPWLR